MIKAILIGLFPVYLIVIIGYLGHKWGKQWIKQGVITHEEFYKLGYMGCFFAKIFG